MHLQRVQVKRKLVWPAMVCARLSEYLRAALVRWGGLSVAGAKKYATHSLRRGGMTAGVRVGVPLVQLMQHGRWRTPEQALRYVQRSEVLQCAITARILMGS